jgi:hypothetical protein
MGFGQIHDEEQSLRDLTLPPDDASHAVLFLKIASKSRLAVSTTIWVRLNTLSFRRIALMWAFTVGSLMPNS